MSLYWLMDGMSPVSENMIYFHDHIMMVLTLVCIFLMYMLFLLSQKKFLVIQLPINHNLEVVWTCVPALLLLVVVFPSLYLLYFTEEFPSPHQTMKVVAHQWYWTYEVNTSLDSYMSTDLSFRLLDVDKCPTMFSNKVSTVYITSADVIHSWSVPSLGVKVDAVPGRLNSVTFYSTNPGVYYGQCSELCGNLHSFMPIKLILD